MLNFDWLSNISLDLAKVIMLGAFIAPLVFGLLLKKSYIYSGSPDNKGWRNLKIWITILSGIMLVVYLTF